MEVNNIDWNVFLAKKTFTKKELVNAERLSADWVTCACGNLCKDIPRHKNGIPHDAELKVLGKYFARFICEMYTCHGDTNLFRYTRIMAIRVLADIEKRSNELIGKIHDKA